MKKLLTGILTASLIATLCVGNVFAGTFIPPGQTDDSIMSNVSPTTQPIPVYGYVGEDAELDDTGNPNDPDAPPVYTPYDINVGVPVKILWAAFTSDEGAITSPVYKIKNYSYGNGVKVTLNKIEAVANNTDIDKYLMLNVHFRNKAGNDLNVGTGGVVNLVDKDNGVTPKYLSVAASITDELNSVSATGGLVDEFRFTLEGTFDTAHWPTSPTQPEYTIEFKFEVAP